MPSREWVAWRKTAAGMAKYVPPHVRARQAEEDDARASGRPLPSREDDDERPSRGGDRFGGGGGGSWSRGKGGGHGGGGDRFGGGDRQGGNSRWDGLKEEAPGRSGGSFSERYGGEQSGGSDWFHRRDGRRPNNWDQLGERATFGERKERAGIDFDEYDKIPVQVTGKNCEDFGTFDNFDNANLEESVSWNIRRCGYDRPTPVQKHAIPIVLAGRDVMACAQTGSGKTCAFMVPCIQSLLQWGPPPMPVSDKPASARRVPAPCALVMSPTRELTSQIFEESRKFAYNTGVRCCVVYGGADMREQRQELNKGCDILVATPGRLTDMFERGIVTLSLVMFFILDEADRMLDMGFEPQVREIVENTDMGKHAPRDRCSMMFSATFPKEVQHMARDFLHDYIFLTVGRVGSASELVEQNLVYANDRDKVRELLAICRRELGDKGLALVFVETKRGADSLERDLWEEKMPVTTIHGDRSQHERERALDHFRTGRTPILVATDVASRGLDIPHVQLVVNFDYPKAIDDYVHRIGRTGRIGRKGKAFTFINEKCPGPLVRDLRELLEDADQEVPQWFEDMAISMRYGRSNRKGGGKGRKGGHRFGGQDMRSSSDWGGGGSRSGGGGGGKGSKGGGHRGGGGYGGGGGFGDRRRSDRDHSPGGW